MTTKRAYRDAMPMETVIKIFKKQRGKQFNPAVADAIITLFGE
jgi:HD-GYP domain-containing protein (c-di-GMP phosphodiesterase class II)